MGFNVDDLINDIQIEYRSLKKKVYPDPELLSKFQEECYTKNNSEAHRFEYRGYVGYERSKYRRALGCYTRSLALAENSEELAIAYAGRSAALFSLGQYEQCLSDINRASGKYPKNKPTDLRVNKKKCLARMKFESDENKENHKHVPDSCEIFKNSLLPSTSSKIKISYGPKWGRHLTATEDIEPGEILSRQKFFSATLELNRYYTHCSYCFTRCDALIPCPSCSMVMYCSENCRDVAFNDYHRIECKMWPFYEVEVSYDPCFLLAMRTLFVGTKQGAQLKTLTKCMDMRDIFKETVRISKKPIKNDYLSMLRLSLTFEKPSEKSISLAIKAVIVLQHLSFFKNDANQDVMSQKELFTTLALLNHMSSIKLYSHKVIEATPVIGRDGTIGKCMQPFLSLVNHSCYQNVTDISLHGREQILFSLRPIKRGEQIFTSYCPPFAVWDSIKRNLVLSEYGFTCHCAACENDWPQTEALIKQEIQFVTNCDEETEKTIKSIIVSNKHSSIPEIGKEIESFSEAVKYCTIIHNNVQAPCVSIFCAELYVITCMFWIWGMKYRTDFHETDEIRSRTKDVHDIPPAREKKMCTESLCPIPPVDTPELQFFSGLLKYL